MSFKEKIIKKIQINKNNLKKLTWDQSGQGAANIFYYLEELL